MTAPGSAERRASIAVFVISAAALALEVLLLRIFAVRWAHHFAHVVIASGLTGFGASGTLLALLGRRGGGAATARTLLLSALCFAVTTAGIHPLGARIPFEPALLPVDLQPLTLAAHLLVTILPFLCAGSFIGAALGRFAAAAPRLYASSLAGSGAGALLATVALHAIAPEHLAVLVSGAGIVAAALVVLDVPLRRARLAPMAVLIPLWLLAAGAAWLAPPAAPSEFKAATQMAKYPDVRLVAHRTGPLGRVEAISSSAFHYAPGLKMGAPDPPPQIALFVDGDSIGAVTHVANGPREIAYLDDLLGSLPYALRRGGRALILGAGGGGDILTALHYDMTADAVEMNADLIDVMTGPLSQFSGDIYTHPDVQVIHGEARGYLRRSTERYHLVVLPALDAFGTSALSGFASGESPLYTSEALAEMLDQLRPRGILALSRWLRQPPREELRLIATASAALELRGVSHPEACILVVRDWSQLVILAAQEPWRAADLDAASRFLDERSFDWVWKPGIEPGDTNRFHKLSTPIYEEAAAHLVIPWHDEFVTRYPFDIAPVTDDRPFFFHTLKAGSWKALEHELGGDVVAAGDWSELLVGWSALLSVALAFFLLIVPLAIDGWLAHRRTTRTAEPAAPAFPLRSYFLFSALGVGYLTVEISLIQRAVLVLAEPVYAAALVLGFLLCASGLGSLRAGRIPAPERAAARALALVVGLTIIYAWFLPAMLAPFRGAGMLWRCIALATLIAPLGFAMGYPFALAVRRLATIHPRALPWAWGVNGFASVIAAAWAAVLALSAGYTAVALAGAAAYACAWLLRDRAPPAA